MKLGIMIAERCKQIMEQKNITKNELIKSCKLSRSTIDNVLQGKSDEVFLNTLYQITKALDVSLKEFFQGE